MESFTNLIGVGLAILTILAFGGIASFVSNNGNGIIEAEPALENEAPVSE